MVLALDCRTVPPCERFELWRDAVSRAFVPLDASPGGQPGFAGALRQHDVGGLWLGEVQGDAVVVRRTRREIRRSDPGHVKVGCQLQGTCLLSQGGRQARLAPGDLAVYDTTRPYTLSFDGTFRTAVVMLPRDALPLPQRALAELSARRLGGRGGLATPASAFLAELVGQLGSDDPATTPDPHLAGAVLALVSATLTGHLTGEVSSRRTGHPGSRRALALRAKAFAEARLADPDLTVAGLAAAQHVSVRQLQNAFAADGSTPSGWLRQRRLERCRQDLEDPGLAGVPVSAVGARWALADPAHFSRAFRAAYGCPPREYRARARRDGSGPVVDDPPQLALGTLDRARGDDVDRHP